MSARAHACSGVARPHAAFSARAYRYGAHVRAEVMCAGVRPSNKTAQLPRGLVIKLAQQLSVGPKQDPPPAFRLWGAMPRLMLNTWAWLTSLIRCMAVARAMGTSEVPCDLCYPP